MGVERFSRYLDQDPALRRLTIKMAELKRLEKLWNVVVPTSLCGYSTPCAIAEGRLSVVAVDGATASKLQQMSASLVKSLQDRGLNVDVILTRVGILPVEQKLATASARVIGGGAREAISQTASSLTVGPLRDALLRLIQKT